MAQQPSEQKIKLANLLAGITITGAILIFALYFVNQKIDTLSRNLINQKIELATLENKEKLISDLNIESESLSKETQTIENILPTSETIINFIKDLENTAAKTGNKITIHFDEKIQADQQTGNQMLNFTVNLEGTGDSTKGFLQELNKLPYFIKVYGMSESLEQSVVRTNLKLGVFVDENF